MKDNFIRAFLLKLLASAAFILHVVFLSSCDIGLGEVVDIEAPELSITKMVSGSGVDETTKTDFDTTIFTKQQVVFYGQASDNVGVSRVHAEVKWLGESDYQFLKEASVAGTSWTLDIPFQKEGACWLKIIVSDRAGNFGTKSSRIVTLFVDNNAPVGDAWYIDRLINGIQYNFKSYESLHKLADVDDPNLLNPSNKNVAQNGTFNICGTLSDSIGVADGMTLTLEPYDHSDTKIEKIPVSSETESNYAPKFKISPVINVGGITYELPKSGKHYYQIKYSAKDLVTDPKPNEVEDAEVAAGYFLWWPESDTPKCYISNAGVNGEIKVHTSDSLNITVFDDDALSGNVVCDLWDSKGVSVTKKTVTISGTTTSETNIIIQVPDKPQRMSLSVTAKDIYNNDLNRIYDVYVTDDFAPTLILTSPENNQIPSVSGTDSFINFTGITLDKSGCKYLEFVWVPDSVRTSVIEKNKLAGDWLDEISTNQSHAQYAPADSNPVKCTEGSGVYAGCKLWSAKLTSAGTEGSFTKHSFDFNLKALVDFGDDTTKEKNFIARVTREDGNSTDTELKLAADNIAPEIQLKSPSGNMSIIDQDQSLFIKYKAVKTSGIGIKQGEYKIYYVDPKTSEETKIDGAYDSSSGLYVSKEITPAELKEFADSNINPKYKVYAEDVLGNKSNATYQFMISTLPVIKTVTSSAPVKCKKGDKISINVSFSKAVTIPAGDTPTLRLKNISNDTTSPNVKSTDEVEAPYVSGSGTTTLIFEYEVKAGDVSSGLQVYNEKDVGPIKGLNKNSIYVHTESLDDANNLQKKRESNPITINGVSPKIKEVDLGSDSDSSNTNNGVTYLKAGRTITATVTTDKKVTVQGSPVFTLKNDNDESKTMDLNFQSISSDGTIIKFSKKITASDANGKYSYDADEYLSNATIFKDEFGNPLSVTAATGNVSTGFYIDTERPITPSIKKADGTTDLVAGKYKDYVEFTISTASGDKTTVTQYSVDAGKTWVDYAVANPLTVIKLESSASLVAKTTDYAGNVSDYSDIIALDINSSFPDFTVECSNPDGNFKCGTVLEFKVSFANKINIPAFNASDSSKNAYIQLSGCNTTDKFTGDGKAYLKEKTSKSGVTEAVFTYTTSQQDDFALKIKKDGLHLIGFTDQYGIGQGVKTLKNEYVRSSLRCDSVAPYVVTMVPGGTSSTQNGLNAYSGAKTITLTFNENVSAVSGNIYLRQTKDWAIPPMFTVDEFNKILNAAKNADIDTTKTYGLTASQVLYMDGLEDAENLFNSLVGAAHDRYHGTAQYVGPYKKMPNGIKADGSPDIEAKYVLDFGVDIWKSADSTKDKFGLTFKENWTKDGNNKTYNTYHHQYYTGWVNRDTPDNTITTDSIRYVLEQAHLHERYMAVNSSYVSVSGNTVTLNFPEGLLGDSGLPLGREWELVIEEGAFMDETGNQFGYEYSDGKLAATDGDEIQIANKEEGNTYTVTENWGRKRSSLSSTEKPVVLIQDGNNAAFMSAGVAKPVIRVDRYSYGLGIMQPTGITDGKVTYQMIDSTSTETTEKTLGKLQTGSTTPTAKVAVRIDCETKGSIVRYAMNTTSRSVSDANNDSSGISKSSETGVNIPIDSATGDKKDTGDLKVIFMAGTGDYKKSCKQFITADAKSGSVTSVAAQEGIFQTVVDINHPLHNTEKSPSDDIYKFGAGAQVVNIHGYTTEPITPYPLRDQLVASSYMRQTYQDDADYYWISYETLTNAKFSMYVYGQNAYGKYNNYGTGNSLNWNDWGRNYGVFVTGEFTVCKGMQSWVSTWYGDGSNPDKRKD